VPAIRSMPSAHPSAGAPAEPSAPLNECAVRQLTSVMDGMPFRRTHALVLGLVAFGTLVNAIEEYNVGLAAPLIATDWSLSHTRVGLLTTLTFAGMAIGAMSAGVVGDHYGRRVPYIYNLGLYTVGALLAAFAPGFGWLLLARFVVGIGLGGELNTGLTLVAELTPTKYRGAAVATVNVAGGGLGIFASSALAALLLGPLEHVLGGPTEAWRWLLGILALPALLLSVYRRCLPESPRFVLLHGRAEETNRVLTRLATDRLGRTSALPTIPFVSVATPPRSGERKVRFSEILHRPLRRNTAVIWVACAMTFGAQVMITVFMPTVLVARGLSLGTSLVYTTIINVGGLVGALLAAWCGYWFKRRLVLGYGALGAAAVSVVVGSSSNLAAIIAWSALLQVLVLLLNTTTFVWAPELYPTRLRAFGTGAAVTVLLISASVTPILAGLVEDAGGANAIFVLVSLMYVIMAAGVRFGSETHRLPLDRPVGAVPGSGA
jgi:MFS family permease